MRTYVDRSKANKCPEGKGLEGSKREKPILLQHLLVEEKSAGERRTNKSFPMSKVCWCGCFYVGAMIFRGELFVGQRRSDTCQTGEPGETGHADR